VKEEPELEPKGPHQIGACSAWKTGKWGNRELQGRAQKHEQKRRRERIVEKRDEGTSRKKNPVKPIPALAEVARGEF